MLLRKARGTKTSLYLTLPSALCDLVGIKEGTPLSIELEQQKIVIAPVPETAKLPELTQTSNLATETPAC